jgi:hypothetical protein
MISNFSGEIAPHLPARASGELVPSLPAEDLIIAEEFLPYVIIFVWNGFGYVSQSGEITPEFLNSGITKIFHGPVDPSGLEGVTLNALDEWHETE